MANNMSASVEWHPYRNGISRLRYFVKEEVKWNPKLFIWWLESTPLLQMYICLGQCSWMLVEGIAKKKNVKKKHGLNKKIWFKPCNIGRKRMSYYAKYGFYLFYGLFVNELLLVRKGYMQYCVFVPTYY